VAAFFMGYPKSTSESIEMYLLRIALLQEAGGPVPVPRLAQELSVSPVSANEMCRKLSEKHLVRYEPYKGVSLTKQGEEVSLRLLRHRRLWEVFFVEKLGFDPLHAEEMACRFEHVTSDQLADNLDKFLGHPTHSPQCQPIPARGGPLVTAEVQPLATLSVGMRGQVARIDTDAATQRFLESQGVHLGTFVRVVAATANGPLLLDIDGQRLSLSNTIAAHVGIAQRSTPQPEVIT
jgi:DtxR family Mn-dependent transcriptional regulator